MPVTTQVQEKVLQTPFQIGPQGAVAFITSPSAIAAQEILAIVLTYDGERLMRSGVGSPFSMQVFSTSLDNDSDFVTTSLLQALQSQVTRSTIQTLHVSANEGAWYITVLYTPLAFSTVLSTRIPITQA